MAALAQGFTFLLQLIADAVGWVGQLFVKVFKALWDMVTDVFVWVFDQVLGIAVTALGALDVSGITPALGAMGNLPGNVIEVLGAAGVGPALGVVVAAIGIRFMLQLIPFVRLGS